MHKLVFAALAGAFMMVGFASEALACSCAPSTNEQRAARADVIVYGRVVSIEDAGGYGARRAVIEVLERYRGPDAPTITLHYYQADGANCGVVYRAGQERTVFGYGAASRLTQTMCSVPWGPEPELRRLAQAQAAAPSPPRQEKALTPKTLCFQ